MGADLTIRCGQLLRAIAFALVLSCATPAAADLRIRVPSGVDEMETEVQYSGFGWGSLRQITFVNLMFGKASPPSTYVYDCKSTKSGGHFAFAPPYKFKTRDGSSYEGMPSGNYLEVDEGSDYMYLMFGFMIDPEKMGNVLKKVCQEKPVSTEGILVPVGRTSAPVGGSGSYTFLRLDRLKSLGGTEVEFWADRIAYRRVRETAPLQGRDPLVLDHVLIREDAESDKTQYRAKCSAMTLATKRIVTAGGVEGKGLDVLEDTVPDSIGEALVERVCTLVTQQAEPSSAKSGSTPTPRASRPKAKGNGPQRRA